MSTILVQYIQLFHRHANSRQKSPQSNPEIKLPELYVWTVLVDAEIFQWIKMNQDTLLMAY